MANLKKNAKSSSMQKTLAGSASLSGLSLHTGKKVTLTLKGAPTNHGIKFRRVDLKDKPFLDAHCSKVRAVERATTLSEGSVTVHTVEHVVSALHGMGVDNAIIEMDSAEPPICDGSSEPFIQAILEAGIEEQDKELAVFEIREPLSIEGKEGQMILILPDKKFRISCTQSGANGKFTQFYSLEVNPQTYQSEIARARTFVYYEEVEALLKKNLIKGGSLENAIVIRGDEIMSKGDLRYNEEFARHKILDIIGDLALVGKRIMGHVIAIKPSHSLNTQMANKIEKEYRSTLAMIPPQINIPTGKAVMNVNEVMSVLPHRYPFLMVDRIIDFSGETKCTGVKSITINEPYFQGHFPEHPVMPGVLQLEAMAQVASILLLRLSENQGKIGYFMSADKVKFRKPVLPGDTLFIEAEIISGRRNIGNAKCRCVVSGVTVSEGELKFILIDN